MFFGWFYKQEDKTVESEKPAKEKNYEVNDDGGIKISAEYDNCYAPFYSIAKERIISHTDDTIVFMDYERYYNHQERFYNGYGWVRHTLAVENKENLIEYKETLIKTFKYNPNHNVWQLVTKEIVGKEIISEKTPLEVFEQDLNSEYKLIETVDEFNAYMSSTLDCDTWCRKKLYDKMKELGLGDGFINQFADLVGNDLSRYYAMIDLANEVADKDTLMYLYTYKFGNKA